MGHNIWACCRKTTAPCNRAFKPDWPLRSCRSQNISFAPVWVRSFWGKRLVFHVWMLIKAKSNCFFAVKQMHSARVSPTLWTRLYSCVHFPAYMYARVKYRLQDRLCSCFFWCVHVFKCGCMLIPELVFVSALGHVLVHVKTHLSTLGARSKFW